jgi:ATP/maltotriose-dependent transcriptional regulator MalT/two-component SAPR family response regulator
MSPIPVSKTKIIPPRRRSELLTRKRLLDMLFEALDRRLTLISAPAGYGKTSLLIDLVDQSDLPCCWLALDELDREPQRFAAYFIAALAERFPGFGSRSNSVLEGMNSFEQEMERLLVTLVNELYEQVKEHFIFVLDDFHLLEGVSPISAFVNRFVQLVDENCHLVISSRMLAILNDLPLLVAREQVSGLGFADLAFRVEELQALVLQNNNTHITDDEATRLIDASEGWITGLQFSDSEVLRGGSKLSGNTSNLFEYFGHQVLDRQTPELRTFVLRTSLLDEFDAALCESVLSPLYADRQDWQQWIKAISQNNLFALPVGEGGRWLRYHHLFRDFIRGQFEFESPDEVAVILVRLQMAYESMGEWGKAHHICRQRKDLDALASLIERASLSMLQSAHLTLESWLNELPPSMLRNRPGLLSIRGAIAYTKGDLQGGLNLLMQSEKIFREQGDTHGLIITLVRRGSAYRFLGDYEASLHDAEEVIALTESNDEWQMLYADALRLKGLALYRLGKADQAVSYLERALDLCRVHDVANVPLLLLDTGMIYRAIGNFSEALRVYEQAMQIWRKEGNIYLQASLLNNLGVFHHSQGNYEKSALAFEEGLLCVQRVRDERLTALLSIGFGDLYAELEDFEMADQNYQNAAEILKKMDNRFLLHFLGISRATLALLQFDSILARNIIEEISDSILSGNSNFENGLLDLVYGRIYLMDGDVPQAVQMFLQAERRFDLEQRIAEKMTTHIWLAAARHYTGESDSALQNISGIVTSRSGIPHAALIAVHQAKNWLNGLQPIQTSGRGLRDLYTKAEKLGKIIPSIRRQLRRQVQAISTPTPRLVIEAFGQASVSVNGRPLTLSDWQTQAVRDLFFYFLSEGRPLTKEQIGEALWQETSDPAKLKLRFKNEMYRLRRAVGQDVILFSDNYYSFNRELDYEYDVEAFDSFLERAKTSNDPLEKMSFYSRAIELVRGHYLNETYADWVIPDRERLRQAYLDALMDLAKLQISQAQPQSAVTTCQRAIESDPGNEAAYQVLMQAYSRLGDRSAVTRTYKECSAAMSRLYNLPLTKETEELYRRLMR